MSEELKQEPLEYFRGVWGCEQALLRLYSSWQDDNFEQSRTMARFVDLMLHHDAASDVPDDEEKRIIGRALEKLRDVGTPVKAGFTMPAMLWIRWALRDAALPLSPKFCLDFSSWLATNDLDKIRYQRFIETEGEVIGGGERGNGAASVRWGGPKNRGKYNAPDGYSVTDLLKLSTLRNLYVSEESESRSEIFGYQWRVRQITRKRRVELIGRPFSDAIHAMIKELHAIDRKGVPPPISKTQSKSKKYVASIPKSEFVKLLRQKPYFEDLSEVFLGRALSTVIAFPRGRPPKSRTISSPRKRR